MANAWELYKKSGGKQPVLKDGADAWNTYKNSDAYHNSVSRLNNPITPTVKENVPEKTDFDRVSSGLKSIGNAWAGTLPLVAETTAVAAKNLNADLQNEDYRKKAQEAREWSALLDGLDENDPQYQVAKAKYDSAMKQLDAVRTNEAVDPNGLGMRLMRESAKQRAEATEGMSGAGKFLADTALGLVQNVPGIAVSVVNPALGAATIGTVSAAQKMYDVQEAGGSADEAFGRGLVSGAIETITEKIPLDTLMDVAKHGGKSAIKNILKQSGIEATEETISYIANLAADKAAGDENAKFSATDLGLSALGGAISGGVLSGAMTGVNKLSTLPSRNKSVTTLPETKPVETAVKAEEAVLKTKSEAPAKEVNTVQALVATPAVANELLGKRDGENGWGKKYYTAMEAVNDAIKTVAPEVYQAFEAEFTDASAKSEAALNAKQKNINFPTPITTAVLAVQEDVRQSVLTPVQGAKLLFDAYKANGVDGLKALYNPHTGNLLPDVLESAKTIENSVETPVYSPEEASVGAAPAGFTGDTERGFSKNLASDTARHQEVQHEYQVNPQKYFRLGNQETLGKAKAIMDTGIDNAVSTLEQALGAAQAGKKFAPEMVPLSKMVGDELAAQGRVAEAERLLSAVAVELTEAGQLGQAANILRDASPATRIQTVTKLVDKLNSKYKGAKIEVDETLLSEYANAESEQAQSEIMENIKNDIASKVPSNWKDKWNAWRYLSMLGNPRTHVRNIFGNAIFQPVRATKDAIGTLIEKAVVAKGGNIQRTKSFVADPELYKASLADYQNVKNDISGNRKYGEGIGDIERRKKVFELPLLEKLRTWNADLLELEDNKFKQMTYADSLAKHLKANGVTAEQMTNGSVNQELLNKAREYAINEALKATYQDSNAVSDIVSKIGRYEGNNPAAKFISTVVEGILPFRRTPANILVRGLEYSPAGLAKGLTADLVKVKNGEMSATQAIDNIASGLTGTALLAAGAVLSYMGVITPGKDENKNQADLDALTGVQNYALNLPDGTSYTLDWAAPSVLPLFMGAELAESAVENGLSLDGILESLKSASEPMLEMSMLQTFNDILDSVSYADNQGGEIVTNALISYLNQAIPTIGGQIERITEDKRMTTYTDKTLPMPRDAQYAIGKATTRLPGDYNQIPYIDAWGREEKTGNIGQRIFENLVSPGYLSKKNETKADKEIQRLLDAGQTGVVPAKPSQSVEVTYKLTPNSKKSMKKNLTAEEYVTYSKVKGETSYDVVNEMISSKVYARMTDEEKAKAINSAYTYATHIAAEAVTNNKHASDKYVKLAQTAKKELGLSEGEYLLLCESYGSTLANSEKIRNAYADGVSPWEYAKYATDSTKRYDTNNSGGVDIAERKKAIEGTKLSEEKQVALWKLAYPDWVKKAEEQGISFENFLKTKLSNY